MASPQGRPLRWAMLIVGFDPVEGHEQGGDRRALVVSYEPIHAAGLMTVCPVTASHATPRRPGEVRIPRGEAGQTRDGLVLCHQVRTISILRAGAVRVGGGEVAYLRDPDIRAAVRAALAVQLGLDVPGEEDGASNDDRFGSPGY